jgi:hypothetical protein
MRVRNLIAAAGAATSLLMLGPPVASAQKHSSPNGLCRININLAPRLIEAGESVLIFGRLRCGGRQKAAAGRNVRLLQHIVGVHGFSVAQTTTTDARGFYELVRSGIEFNSSFVVRSQGAVSAARPVGVLAHVTLVGPPDGSQITTGAANKVTFTGTVSPHDVGAHVVLQRQNANAGDEWRRIDAGTVEASGNYTITHTFVVPGDADIRVLVRSQRRNVASPSPVLTYEISQAQNPNLTINASSNPIAFGQHVTITGTVAGQPNTIVKLLAHTAAQPTFVAVAEAKTDASGNYTFPAQAPVSNTFYQVSGVAGKLSAVLFEGVKDLLTAQVSASSIKAGQTLTFSGAVAPDHTGHVIYLERQNRVGADFHVVQVGVVGPGSAYSIEHAVFDPGVKVFRVRIPGGPENEGAASTPFTVSVTHALARALKPEAPSNTTLPSEGEA